MLKRHRFNDLYVFNDNLYIATSNGLLNIDYLNDILSLSNSWNVNLSNLNISSIVEYQSNIYLSYENKIIDINFNEIVSLSNEELIKSMEMHSNKLLVITNLNVYSYYFFNNTIETHMIPDDYNNSIVSYLELDDFYYYGIENKGVLIYNSIFDQWNSYIPNTIYKNQFDALALLDNGSLFGIVNHKNNRGQSGGFTYKNPLLLRQTTSEINNFYSYNSYNINKYPLSSGNFKANLINYWSGDNTIHSAIFSNDKNKQMTLKQKKEYYQYMGNEKVPKICIVEDSNINPVGCFWGEVQTNIHKKLGFKGVITNGSIRDLDDAASNFQMLARSVLPSHACLQLKSIGKAIKIFGEQFKHNDIVHADQHGAVKIPLKYLEKLPEAIKQVIKNEKPILDLCKGQKFSLKKLEDILNKKNEYH